MTDIKFIDLKKLKRVLPFLFFMLITPLCAKNTILISIDGVGKDDLKYMKTVDSLASSGVKALSLQPVFPTQTLPNVFSILSGKLPKEHGISANFFKNKHTNVYYGYDVDDCNSKWINTQLIWKELNQIGINTISIDYPLQNKCENNLNSPDFALNKDSVYLEKLSQLINDENENFVAIHFKDADNAAHQFGNKTKEFINSLQKIDGEIKQIIELFNEDDNFIIHSTFGTVELDSTNYIDLNEFTSLQDKEYINLGSMLLVYDYLTTANLSDVEKNSESYSSFNEIPEYFNAFTNYNSPRRLLVADKGYVFTDDPIKLEQLKAVHGYDANLIEMHGFFTAFGNDIKTDYQTGSIEIQHIYDIILELNGINTENKNKIIHLID